MSDQRQPFRFRLPWLPAAPQAAPTAPLQRPPFRPAGLAPPAPAPAPSATQPRPTPSQGGAQFRGAARVPASAIPSAQPASPPPQATTTEVSPPSPSRVTRQSGLPSQVTASPSRRGSQSRVTSPAASPSRARPPYLAASLPASPSRVASQAGVSSQPPSPLRVTQRQQPPEPTLQPQKPTEPAPEPQQVPEPSPEPQQPPKPTPELQQPPAPAPEPQQSPKPSPEPQQPPEPAPEPQQQPEQTPQSQQPPEPTLHPTSQPPSINQPVHAETSPPSSPYQAPSPVKPSIKSPFLPSTETSIDDSDQPPAVSDQGLPKMQDQSTQGETVQPSPLKTQPMAIKISEAKPSSEEESQNKAVNQPDPRTKQPLEVSGGIKADGETPAEQAKISVQKLDLKPGPESERKSEVVKEARRIEEGSKGLLEEQRSKEQVFDKKEVLTTSGARLRPSELASSNYPKVTRPPQRPAAIPTGEKAPLHKEIKEDISKFVHRLGVGQPNQPPDERPFSIITIAGENRGSSMQLGSEQSRRDGSVHIHRGYKTDPDETTETTTDGEDSSKNRRSGDRKVEEDTAGRAYINSNVQGVNNSLVFTSSVAERNPGVQFSYSRRLIETEKVKNGVGSSETHKAEFNRTPAEKLTYAPNVRRRCLRGLFVEPSDSDPDDPEKPRRHGCRYDCTEKNKDKVDIL